MPVSSSDLELDFGMPDYALDQGGPQQHYPVPATMHPQPGFNADPFSINDDPILHSAGPYQQNFTFSPTASPLAASGPFSNMYNGPSMASSMNSTTLYSSPASGYPSVVSTPQPSHDEQYSFYLEPMDLRQQYSVKIYATHRTTNL